jgi:hypothetical protein
VDRVRNRAIKPIVSPAKTMAHDALHSYEQAYVGTTSSFFASSGAIA